MPERCLSLNEEGDCRWIFTCEHGGYHVPAAYQQVFAGKEKILQSHRGYDAGALELARFFSKHLNAPLFYSQTTRLLIELNRSLHHRQLFSSYSRILLPEQKETLIKQAYFPYRAKVENAIDKAIKERGRVLHISFHSFTPKLAGEVRKGDIGLLYDPRRSREKAFCRKWKQALQKTSDFRVRCNYPYLGRSDGFVTYLRSLYGEREYLGIEIEVNQRFPLANVARWRRMKFALLQTFRQGV